jgi:hypothetical protein
VLAVTPEGDESRAALVDNLAASIYKQGELANEAKDYRAAADHFLRFAQRRLRHLSVGRLSTTREPR